MPPSPCKEKGGDSTHHVVLRRSEDSHSTMNPASRGVPHTIPHSPLTAKALLTIFHIFLFWLFPSLLCAQTGVKGGGPSINPQQPPAIQFTDEEKDWVKDHPRIRLGVDPDLAPFSFMVKGERFMGISAEYIEILNKRLGLNMAAVPGLTWKEVVAETRKGTIDVLACIAPSEERRAYLSFSRPYLTFTRVLITRADVPFLTGLADVTHMRVATRRDSSHESYLREQVTLSPILYDTVQQGLLAVSTGVIDAYVSALAPAAHWIRQMRLTNLKVALSLSAEETTLHLAVRKDWPELVSILNKGLVSINETQGVSIAGNWTFDVPEPTIGRSWLENPVIVLAAASLFLLLVILAWRLQLGKEFRRRQKAELSLQRSKEFEELTLRATSRFTAIQAADVDTAINTTLADIAVFAKADAAYLYLMPDKGSTMVMTHDYHSHKARETLQAADQLDTQKMEWWLQRMGNESVLPIENAATLPGEAEWEQRFTQSNDTAAMLDISLQGRDELIGFTGVSSAKPKGKWDFHCINLLTQAAQLFTSAIEQKRLELQLSLSAYKDPLTGLANRLYFDEVCHKEWYRAQRDQILLSTIHIDIDTFDVIKNSHGHRVGDACLCAVGDRLASCLQRSSDLIARFDDTGFAVLLINTDSRGATRMADTMREEILARSIALQNGPRLDRLTISAGVATLLPEHNLSPGLLTEKAGKALQEAKDNGGNQVIHTLR